MIVSALAVTFNWNLWLAMAVAMAFAVLVGFFNGYLVLRTGLPSFIVTLATLYIVRGATTGATRLLTGRTQIGGLDKRPGSTPRGPSRENRPVRVTELSSAPA